MPEVSFDRTPAEDRYIRMIVTRAAKLAESVGTVLDRLEITMDLAACHANGCPMDFKALVNADDFNFTHDVGGINRHIDRETGKLGGCFRPRFALRDGRG